MSLKKLLFSITFIFPFCSLAQFTDDFTDGDFTANPVWSGNTANFEVNTSNQLHLNAPAVTDTSYLSTPCTVLGNGEWNLWVKQSFASSANNFGRIYLVSDQGNLKGPLNGYFVEVGDASDSVTLWVQSGVAAAKIISGTIANTNNSTNTLRVKVTRDSGGLWKLYTDTLGGVNYQLEGSATDVTHPGSAFFGVWCKYTTSNSTKFYYDEIYTGPIIVDVTPASITNVFVISPTQIDVQFSEGVELTSSETESNYSVNNGIGAPSSAVRDAADLSRVHLTFSIPFTSGLLNTLTVNGVNDFNSNPLSNAQAQFVYYIPQKFDVVINEIMADPDPQVGLPNYEFVEIFNRKNFPLNVSGWTITIGSTTKTIPDFILPADSFALLSGTTAAVELASFGIAIGVTSFPSITNTGATITLRDNYGNFLSSVTYADGWYGDAAKSEGGFTLEQIDPNTPCAGPENWKASADVTGGTPGRKNSVFGNNPDVTPPGITGAIIISSQQIKLSFSETADSATISNNALYSVNQGIGTPDSVRAITPGNSSVNIYFSGILLPETIYTITVGSAFTDCAGNLIGANNSTQVAIHDALQFDVVFNEIMADPDPPVGLPDYEYVEFYNRSDFPINLSNWKLTAGSTVKSLPEMTILPKNYLAISSEAGAIALKAFGGNVAGMSSFISVSNEGSMLILSDTLGKMISMADYGNGWYNDAGKDDGGWSIEKIDYDNACGGIDNWSASSDPNGGTPGKKNSVFEPNPDSHIPFVVRASFTNAYNISVYFSEWMDSVPLNNPVNYSIDNGIGTPSNVMLSFPDYSKAALILPQPLVKGIIYTVTATGNLTDCDGKPVTTYSSARVAMPDTAAISDIVINEILYNPKTDGYDFVEIYNRSQKVFDLKNVGLASADLITDSIEDIKSISTDGYLIFPGQYLVLTSSPKKTAEHYPLSGAGDYWQMTSCFEMSSMPSYNVDEDVVSLTGQGSDILDKIKYSDKWQFPLLTETKGVSLERIHFDRPSQDSTNWHSAAEAAGFATPGYKNSQFSDGYGDGSEISVEPEIFSPDGDGNSDVLNIHYKFDVPGYTASVFLFDAKGRLIRTLVKNELLGSEGVWSWDGITDKRDKAPIGIYIIYSEAFNLEGKEKHFKKTAVLAGKL